MLRKLDKYGILEVNKGVVTPPCCGAVMGNIPESFEEYLKVDSVIILKTRLVRRTFSFNRLVFFV